MSGFIGTTRAAKVDLIVGGSCCSPGGPGFGHHLGCTLRCACLGSTESEHCELCTVFLNVRKPLSLIVRQGQGLIVRQGAP